jgi:PGF-pre-PGF domain-containing protein
VLQTVPNVTINVSELSSRPAEVTEPSGKIYKYLDILAERLTNSDISSATIHFKVEKSWIQSAGLNENEIRLLRYSSNQWETLETRENDEDNIHVYYTATAPGFSVFAISGTKAAAAPSLPQTNVPTTQDEPFEPSQPAQEFPYMIVVIVTVVAIVVALAVFIKRRSPSEIPKDFRKTKTKFKDDW